MNNHTCFHSKRVNADKHRLLGIEKGTEYWTVQQNCLILRTLFRTVIDLIYYFSKLRKTLVRDLHNMLL